MICFSIKLETEWFGIFFSRILFVRVFKEYHVKQNVLGYLTLVDSLDHIYDKMPKLLEQYE